MKFWNVYCMGNHWPSLWRRYFQHQVAAVGFPPQWGYRLEGKSKSAGWSRVRNALKAIQVGDKIVVQLNNSRIGRIGEVVRKEVGDKEWNPLVPVSRQEPVGEMGRCVAVRWDLVNGPVDQDLVVELPSSARLTTGLVRPTICALPRRMFKKIAAAVGDRRNWVSISTHAFSLERSISDYLGTYPYRLEDGLQSYPLPRVRENVFSDGTRSDVLLIDGKDRPVIVECKQSTPTIADIRQIRGCLRKAWRVIGKKVRGIYWSMADQARSPQTSSGIAIGNLASKSFDIQWPSISPRFPKQCAAAILKRPSRVPLP